MHRELPVKIYHAPWFDLEYGKKNLLPDGASIQQVAGVDGGYLLIDDARKPGTLWLPDTMPAAERRATAEVVWAVLVMQRQPEPQLRFIKVFNGKQPLLIPVFGEEEGPLE
jgi:hypothetical protein